MLLCFLFFSVNNFPKRQKLFLLIHVNAILPQIRREFASIFILIDSGIHLLSDSNIPSCRDTELVWKISVKIRPIAAPQKLRAKTTFAPVVIRASQGPQQQGPVSSRHHIAGLQSRKKRVLGSIPKGSFTYYILPQ